ncbi:MAG: hypothetical protein ACFCU4_09220 [Puniceicoccaceae bacterium]
MGEAIDRLNDAMIAARVCVFVGGLEEIQPAISLRHSPGGDIRTTREPYLGTGEYVGGFWIQRLSSPEEALMGGRKAALACLAPVELRAFNE